MRLPLALALCSALLTVPAVAQQPTSAASPASKRASAAPRTMSAVRRTAPITIDGRLDEAAWASAAPSGGFVQSYPKPGQPAPDQTEVRVLYDDDAIYVGIRMFDAHPDSIAAGLARRDATAATGIYSDWVHLIIDSYHDRRTAFRFSTTPRGVQKDVYTSNDGNEDTNWDAVWEVGTRVDSLGWVAEYRIPLSQLRFGGSKATDRVWGFQVQRDIARRNERDTWAPWTPNDGGFVSRFGDLTGITGISVPTRLEVTPYVSSTLTRGPGEVGDPFYQHTQNTPKVGGDLRYGLPGGLTLSATINPDFGQVEVDPAVVNLSAFETSFPEKRPFFLEGSDVFNFGQVVRQNDYGGHTFLYSRRIGRQPQLGLPGNTAYADMPTQTTIASAAKVTGKTGPWTVGILDAVTTEQRARVLTTGGLRYDRPVEPFTNYFAGRVKRDFRGGATTVGAMLENTNRAVGDTTFAPLLRSNATFGGLDFEHDMMKRSWIASGFVGGSLVQGSERAIAATQRTSAHYFNRPDSALLNLSYDTTRTSLAGLISEVALQKNGNTFGSIALKTSSPGLELNDLGLQGRTGYSAISTLIGRQSYTAGKHLSSWSAFVYQNDAFNYGGRGIFHGYAANGNATFLNQWGMSGGFNYSPDYYDDVLLRGGPEGRQPASWTANLGVNTDTRRPLVLEASTSYAHDILGGYQKTLSLSFDTRPSANVHLNFGPSWSRLHDTEQPIRSVNDPLAIETYGRRYVLATLTQNTLSLDTRMDVTLSPTLSFVMYVQPFVSAGSYGDYKELARPGTYQFNRYGVDQIDYDATNAQYVIDPDGTGAAPSFTVSQPNFNVRSLRGNAVVRWDYRPGSSLYFVWQQERSDFAPIGEFDGRRDVDAIFRTIPTNVFLVKATYWIGK
jgi:uncharacterized protein DUF5916/cellulose/xylan binding protein with CBM9 domain